MPLRLVIWTTTPWTIPANLAISVNGDLNYSVASHPSLRYRLVVATSLLASLGERLGLNEGGQLTEASALVLHPSSPSTLLSLRSMLRCRQQTESY